MGLLDATVQSKTLSEKQSNTMFWLNVAMSVLVAVILLLLAPLTSWFYDDVRAGYITAAFSVIVLITGLSLQHTALLTRDLRYNVLSVNAISQAVGHLADYYRPCHMVAQLLGFMGRDGSGYDDEHRSVLDTVPLAPQAFVGL